MPYPLKLAALLASRNWGSGLLGRQKSDKMRPFAHPASTFFSAKAGTPAKLTMATNMLKSLLQGNATPETYMTSTQQLALPNEKFRLEEIGGKPGQARYFLIF